MCYDCPITEVMTVRCSVENEKVISMPEIMYFMSLFLIWNRHICYNFINEQKNYNYVLWALLPHVRTSISEINILHLMSISQYIDLLEKTYTDNLSTYLKDRHLKYLTLTDMKNMINIRTVMVLIGLRASSILYGVMCC